MIHRITLCVLTAAVAVVMTLLAPGLRAAELTDRQWFNLYEGAAPGALGEGERHAPALQPYLPPKERATGAVIVVIPGGGYGGLAMDHEGKQIGEALNAQGITAFVLRYRLGSAGYRHPVMLNDAKRAVRTVRANAKAWGLDPDRIGIIGFSAGGHLASTLSTHFDAGDEKASDPIERVSSRPDCATLVYPVITMGRHTHQGSKDNLLGKDPDPKLVEDLSNEKRVTKDTPPTFLFHSTADKAVPVQNSDLYAGALAANDVKYVYVRGDHGGHGIGLKEPWRTPWFNWLRELGYAAKEPAQAAVRPAAAGAAGVFPAGDAARVAILFPWNADLSDRRPALRRAVDAAIASLKPDQQFTLAAYGHEGAVKLWPAGAARPATDENKAAAREWLDGLSPRLGDPLPTFRAVLERRPKAVYLLADRDYQGRALVPAIREANFDLRAAIHTYSVAPASAEAAEFEAHLKAIAEANKGTFHRLARGE